MPTILQAALAALTGQPAATPPPPAWPHPLGPEARFPPRIARLVGLESRPLTGTPRPLPGLPFCSQILDFREAIRLDPVPRRAVLVGAGYIGAELALGWAHLGCAVTLLDRRPRLMPGYAPAHVAQVQRLLEAAGVRLRLGIQVTGWQLRARGVAVRGRPVTPTTGQARWWTGERIVVAVGLMGSADAPPQAAD